MAITTADILSYIRTNRLHFEDSKYLLQEKVDTMGVDGIDSAMIWVESEYRKASRLIEYEAFERPLVGLDPTDLTGLPGVRSGFIGLGISNTDARTYMHLFECIVLKAIANIFRSAGMHDEADTYDTKAQELLDAILVEEDEDAEETVVYGVGDVVVDELTEAEITTLVNGYE